MDDQGRLIGVPTQAAVLDCRPPAQDPRGSCRPSGGSLGYVRPIAVAQPLLTAAGVGDAAAGPAADRPRGALPTPRVLLHDDFSDPAAGRLPQQSSEPSFSRVGYEGGEYVIAKVDPADPGAPIVTFSGYGADAAIAVDARLVGAVDGRYLELDCRRSAAGRYGLVVEPGQGSVTLLRVDGDQLVVLASVDGSSIVHGGTATNRLELDCVGTTITGRVNGVPLVIAQDDRYADGALAMGTGVYGDRLPGIVEARFANLTITAP